MIASLPAPLSNQAFFNVSAVDAGELSLPSRLFLDPCPLDEDKLVVPALCFLLRHSASEHVLLFDLGYRKDYHNHPPAVIRRISLFQPLTMTTDAAESLQNGGLAPTAVTHVCLSHVHWDHAGDPRPFANATFLVGAGARALLQNGYPHDPDALFAGDLLPAARTAFLDPAGPEWRPVGPFPRALDYFGDGSVYVVDAPGHLPGHVNALVRTSPDGGWIYLAGDSAHDWRIVTGEAGIAERVDRELGMVVCAHKDKAAAEEHIARIRELLKLERVRVLLAHDSEWYKENRGGPMYWPGQFETL